MNKTYKMTIAGIERELPLFAVNDKLDIAAFIMFSDVEITVACAEELLKKVPEFDVLITAESKGIPLAYEMARQSGKPYVVIRKSVKVYMKNSTKVTVKSITTAEEQTMYLGEDDMDKLPQNVRDWLVNCIVAMAEHEVRTHPRVALKAQYEFLDEFEKELKDRRNELTRQERRVTSKEETLDRKIESAEKKDENLFAFLYDLDVNCCIVHNINT